MNTPQKKTIATKNTSYAVKYMQSKSKIKLNIEQIGQVNEKDIKDAYPVMKSKRKIDTN